MRNSRGKAAIITGIFLASAAGADTKWIQLQTDHFIMFSSAGEGNSRETLRNFEQVRTFFGELFGIDASKQPPVYVIAFNNEKEFAPYRPNEFAAAYYMPGADRDYIVMSKAGFDLFRIAAHEYIHLIVQHAGLQFPPWFGEGMAEFYSTAKPQAGKILIGEVIPGHAQTLLDQKWVPVSEIVKADHDSPYYNEKNRAGSLYAEGWALVHMLSVSEKYRGNYSAFFKAMSDGRDAESAFQAVYGVSLAQVDKDLQGYIRSSTLNAQLYNLKFEKQKKDLPATPASEFDVNLALSDLVNKRGNEADVMARLEKLAATDTKRPEPWAGLAYMAWRSGNTQEASAHFEKAFDLGARNPRLLWDFGRMGQENNKAKAELALKALQQLQPARMEVQLEIIAFLVRERRTLDALAALGSIKKITPEDAPRLFSLMTYAHLQDRDLERARSDVAQLEKYAKNDRDKAELSRLKGYVEQATPRAVALPQPAQVRPAVPPAANNQETTDGRPVIRRRQRADGSFEVVYAEPPAMPTLTGTFLELVCIGEQAKVVLQTSEGRKTLLIERSEDVSIAGQDAGATLECGKQSPANIRAQYHTKDGLKDADGVLEIIFYLR
jgi:tetratricopeptide (TPR) repeat protein